MGEAECRRDSRATAASVREGRLVRVRVRVRVGVGVGGVGVRVGRQRHNMRTPL